MRELMLAACLVTVSSGAWLRPAVAEPALQLPAAGDAIYAYTDDRGRLIHVQRFADVPERFRAHAQRVDQPERAPVEEHGLSDALFDWATEAVAGRSEQPHDLYGYRGPDGRVVYTNLRESVPPGQRGTARIDLDALSLNTELGSDLDRQLARRHRVLQASAVCSGLREAAQEAWWTRVWRERAPLVVCGGALLFGVLLTPWMLRKGWGASWARVLSTAVPVLGFVGISAFLVMQTERSVSEVRSRAERCDSGTFARAGGLRERMQLVQALQAEQRALDQIHAESR